jgi:C-terminal processing protease CtpA/Prc
MEVLEVNGVAASKWLEQRIQSLADTCSFSSPQHAFSFACHWGLADYPGTKLALVLRKPKGKKTERELTYVKANPTPWGPAYWPKNMKSVTDEGDVNYALIDKKWGYVHLRRSPGDLPEQVDVALTALEDAKGLILDFRGNSGGGFDHDAFLGRFVPAGKVFSSGKDYACTGPHPFGGPIVVIIDATVRSAGETGAGLFKDDGRGYVIGESPTAGMSSQKTTIVLPSKLFALYVSIDSNKGRYNEGRGLEGIGVIPHRIVEFDPDDLEQKVDTLIKVAQELLEKFPQKDVRYDPKDFGWKR